MMKGKWSQNLQFWSKIAPQFGSLQTILLCIVWELAGGGSVAVAVGVSYM